MTISDQPKERYVSIEYLNSSNEYLQPQAPPFHAEEIPAAQSSNPMKVEMDAHETAIAKKQLQTKIIMEALGATPFVMDKEKVGMVLNQTGVSKQELLQELIPIAKQFARPPISDYKVGAALLGKSGSIYLGVNLEFPGFHLNQTIHGEQFAVIFARLNGETEIEAIALSAAPCGHCRQFLNELGKDLDILTPNKPPRKLSELLPDAFGPKDLGLEGNLLTPGLGFRSNHPDRLVAMAIEAYRTSYAPYSKSRSGLALQTHEGKIYVGHYLENAAFNPTVSPLQSALVALVADKRGYDDIATVILAENPPPQKTSHIHLTRELLKRIAPQATFLFYCNQQN
jgi:cytidine deaminase